MGKLNDENRAKKRPIREVLQHLKVQGGKTREGYQRRWVRIRQTNSTYCNSVDELKALGYSVVEDETLDIDRETATKLGSEVRKKERNGDEFVLMEIPLDEYREIQAIKHERVKDPSAATGEGIKEGKLSVNHSFNLNS